MALKLITAAASYPVTTAEARARLRIDHYDDDDDIASMIAAATAHAEQFTGRAFIDQTWDYYLDAFPASGAIQIPKPPLIGIEGVFSRDSAGTETQIAAAGYLVDSATAQARLALIFGGTWPTIDSIVNAVRIRFRAGYVDYDSSPAAGEVPADIKNAILMIVGTLYAHRETIVIGQSAVALPWGAEHLLRQHRVHTAIA